MVQHSLLDHTGLTGVTTLSFGSNSNSVSSFNAAGASPSNTRADHVHLGVTSLAHTSNTFSGPVTLVAGANVGITSPSSGNYRIDVNSATGGGGGGVSAGQTGLLAVNRYAPTSQTVFSTTSGSMVDVHATNMAVTFTAPTSGNIIVRLNAFGDMNGAAGEAFWGLRESTTNLSIARVMRISDAESYHSVAFYLTGVTAGSHTYKWSFGVATATSETTRIIVMDGSAINEWGPGIMEVWAAPA